MWLQVFIPTEQEHTRSKSGVFLLGWLIGWLILIRCVLAWLADWLADPNQVCSCLVGMKNCSHMALYWISLTHMF